MADQVRIIRVGTFFEHRPKRAPRISAYTQWYSPSWSGCVEYDIPADNVPEAKRIAIARRRHEEAADA